MRQRPRRVRFNYTGGDMVDVACVGCGSFIPIRISSHGWISAAYTTRWYQARLRADGGIEMRVVCSSRCRKKLGAG